MFNDVFRNKKIIITGDTGFKGAWLTIWLHHLGARIVGIAKDIPTSPSLFEELHLADKIDHHFADICDVAKMKQIFKEVQPDFVFHLAAQPIVSVSYADPLTTFQTNIMGTANILEALRSLNHPCKAVIITSDKSYDNVEWVWGYRETDALGGKDPYSASKGAAELVIKAYYHSYFKDPTSKIKLVSTRAGNVVGGGDWAVSRIVPDCVRAWSQGEKVKVRNPNSTRPWLHVLEPLSGYLRAAQILTENPDAIHGQPFNFGPNSDQNHTVLELLQAISRYWNFSNNNEEQFVIEPESSFHEAGLLKLNYDKALFYLQWKPTLNFEETARFTGQWYNTYYNENSDIYSYTIKQIEEYANLAKEKRLSWTN